MSAFFRLVSLPPFERDIRKLSKRNPKLIAVITELRTILREDPYNQSRHHSIKKLSDVPERKGQWRIRAGNYRLRYDIVGHDVVLHSFRHRKDVYRGI